MKDINGIDILVIVLFFLTFAILLGMKIVSIIDRKINSITVNVPEPKVVLDYNRIRESFDNKNSNNQDSNNQDSNNQDNNQNNKDPEVCRRVVGEKPKYKSCDIKTTLKNEIVKEDTYSPLGYNISNYSRYVEPEYAGVRLLPKDNRGLYPKYADKKIDTPMPSGYVE